MAAGKDWNAIFAKEMATHILERSQTLSKAKAAAAHTNKELFDADRFKQLYIRLNSDDVNEYTPWETLIKESEYDYYVVETDKMNLEEFVIYLKWLQGWG